MILKSSSTAKKIDSVGQTVFRRGRDRMGTRLLDELDCTLGSLEQLSSSLGPTTNQFLKEFDNPKEPTTFRSLDVTGGKDVNIAIKDSNVHAKEAVKYTEKRFQSKGVLQDFDVLDPTNWPTTDSVHEKMRFLCILKIIRISLLLPMNAVVCERGFSMMNRIKTEESGMLNSALNALMYISTDGPSLEDFDPQPAVNYWAGS